MLTDSHSPTRILVIANSFPMPLQPQNGIFVLRQLQALKRTNIEVLVVRLIPWAPVGWRERWRRYRSVPQRFVFEGVQVHIIRALILPRLGGAEYLPRQVHARLKRIVDEFEPDVIHAHGILSSGLLALGWDRPVVVTAHGSDAYDFPQRRAGLKKATQKVLRSGSKLVAVSDFIRQHMLALGAPAVDVIYNGADDRLFFPRDRDESRRTLGLPFDRSIIAFAGNVLRAKGIFDLAAAVNSIRSVRAMLVFAGEGPDRQLLQQQLAQDNVDHVFLGVVDHEKLAALLSAADVVALPSYREGLPAVICEAMLAGCAIVASKAGGIPEIILDDVTGKLVDIGRPDLLATALECMLNDAALRSRLSHEARIFAREHLTWDVNARAYAALYESAKQASLH